MEIHLKMYVVSHLNHRGLLAQVCLTELGHQAFSWTHGDLLLLEHLKTNPSSVKYKYRALICL